MSTEQSRLPILVTGAPRSGTTWVATMMAAAPETQLIREPFNIEHGRWLREPLSQWFTCFDPDERSTRYEDVRRVLEFRYPGVHNLTRRPPGATRLRIIKDWARAIAARRIGAIPLVKDPIVVFSVPWMAQQFGARPLVLVRRPEALVSSFKRLRWNVNFEPFVRQPQLYRLLPSPLQEQVKEAVVRPLDVVDGAILLWNCVYSVHDDLRRAGVDWLFVRHEDLSSDPIAGFRRLYSHFGLTWSEQARSRVAAHSSMENPAEAPSGELHLLRRNSKQALGTWQTRLTAEEVDRVRASTDDVLRRWYGEIDGGEG